MAEKTPVVLTIAGFDPSSGAGVTADIKTISAHGCYGVAAITAMTVQSTAGVKRVEPADPALLIETLEELASDVEFAAVHIGMLGSGKVARAVADFLSSANSSRAKLLPNIVLDPIFEVVLRRGFARFCGNQGTDRAFDPSGGRCNSKRGRSLCADRNQDQRRG